LPVLKRGDTLSG